MDPRIRLNGSASADDGGADQRQLLRLVRTIRAELAKRIPDLGCMTPDEMRDFLWAWDQAMDLHVAAALHDERIDCGRQKLQRAAWSGD